MYCKDLNNFTFIKSIGNGKNTGFSHAVALYQKDKTQSHWFVKYTRQNYQETISEVIAQELFRLLLPYQAQPKTRWIKGKLNVDNTEVHYFVISKAIAGFDPFFLLRQENYDAVINGQIKGLGAIQVVSLLVMEVDLKAGNVGVDEHCHSIKIDGGLAFRTHNQEHAPRFKAKNMDITVHDLQALPLLAQHSNYYACNWLDYIQWDATIQRPNLNPNSRLAELPANAPAFRQEVNETILRILLLSKKLIYNFTHRYIPEAMLADQFADFIVQRKRQLKKAAQQDMSFLNYKTSKKAEKDILNYISYLKSFKTMGKQSLLPDSKKWHSEIEEPMRKKFINGYLPIKSFFIRLDAYLQEVNNLHTTHGFLPYTPYAKKINLMRQLKQTIESYFNKPYPAQLKAVYKMLLLAKIECLKQINFSQTSTLLSLIISLYQQLRPLMLKNSTPCTSTKKITGNDTHALVYEDPCPHLDSVSIFKTNR
jgi:hypothetical protein